MSTELIAQWLLRTRRRILTAEMFSSTRKPVIKNYISPQITVLPSLKSHAKGGVFSKITKNVKTIENTKSKMEKRYKSDENL